MAIERHVLVPRFFAVLRKLNNTNEDILEVRKFFEQLSEIRSYVPPTIEFMTVLKAFKPKLFQEFKG